MYLSALLAILLIDVLDFLPPPDTAVLTFREGNMGRPLCKEIIIVPDNITEGLEEFDVQLANESEVGVGVQFDPNVTTVKITELFNPSIVIANDAQASAESAAQAAASAISFITPSIVVANAAQATAESAARAAASANASMYCTTTSSDTLLGMTCIVHIFIAVTCAWQHCMSISLALLL